MKKLFLLLLMAGLWSCTSNEGSQPNQTPAVAPDNSIDPTSLVGKDYLIDAQHSYIGFKIKYFGFSPVRGRFNAFDGTLFYDSDDLSSLSVTVYVDVNSINTADETRDDDLTKEGSWFDAAKYPFMHFSSQSIISKTDGSFDLIGNLTIKGTTKTDTIRFQKPTDLSKDWAGNDQVDFSGKMIIDRQDFNVFGGDFWSSVMENGLTQLSDEVEIELDIHARRADYQIRFDDADSSNIRKIVLNLIRNQGIEAGINYINDAHQNGELTAGMLSTIGYTLNLWKMHEEALVVFEARLKYFPERSGTWNQLGITQLLLGKSDQAINNFSATLSADSIDSRAHEYIRLAHRIK